MDKPEGFSRLTLHRFTVVTTQQLEDLWSRLKWPKEPLPVLDVGCGPGDIAAKILTPRLPPGTQVVACDISPEMLKYAKERNSVPGVITHELFDVMDPDLHNTAVWKYGPYSKVFSLLLLHWVPDNRRAIQNIHELLVPGGEAIFTVIPKIALYSAYEKMAEDPRWKDYMQDLQRFISPYQHSPDPATELCQILEEEGFEVLHSWIGPQHVVFNTDEQVKDGLVAVSAFVNCIPPEQKEEFIDDTLQWVYKLNGIRKEQDNSTGEIKLHYLYTSMVVLARKLQAKNPL